MLSKAFIIIVIITIILLIFIYLFVYYLPMRVGTLASQKFNEWQQIYGRVKARQMIVNWLEKQLIVKDVGISEDGTIWIEFRNGMEANISTSLPNTL